MIRALLVVSLALGLPACRDRVQRAADDAELELARSRAAGYDVRLVRDHAQGETAANEATLLQVTRSAVNVRWSLRLPVTFDDQAAQTLRERWAARFLRRRDYRGAVAGIARGYTLQLMAAGLLPRGAPLPSIMPPEKRPGLAMSGAAVGLFVFLAALLIQRRIKAASSGVGARPSRARSAD